MPCGDEIKHGEYIVNHAEHGYIHEECVYRADEVSQIPRDERTRSGRTPDTMPRGRTAKDRCGVCFQIPASNGACGC